VPVARLAKLLFDSCWCVAVRDF